MNAPVTPPVLTLDELIRRADVDCDAIGQIAYVPHMTAPKAEVIAATAITLALDAWEFEEGVMADPPMALLAVAMQRVMDMGWAAREKRFEDARQEEEVDSARKEY